MVLPRNLHVGWESRHLPPQRTAAGHDVAMWIGWIEFDLLLGDVHSLKQKRSVVRPIVAEIKRKFEVSAVESSNHDLHRRAGVGVAVAATDAAHLVEQLDRIERLVANRPEVDLLSTRRGLHSSEDE